MFAAQGLEFRRPLKSSKIIEENYEIIREKVKKLEKRQINWRRYSYHCRNG